MLGQDQSLRYLDGVYLAELVTQLTIDRLGWIGIGLGLVRDEGA